jgi:hypothetical protein
MNKECLRKFILGKRLGLFIFKYQHKYGGQNGLNLRAAFIDSIFFLSASNFNRKSASSEQDSKPVKNNS